MWLWFDGSIQSLHMQNNNLTDRALDHLTLTIRNKSKKNLMPALKSVYLN